MKLSFFIKENKETWSQLETLIHKFQKKQKEISAEDIDLLTSLYKQISTHVSYAQTYFPTDEITIYLNELITQAHHILYKEQFKSKHQLAYFFKEYFITLIRKRHLFILFAFLLFFIGALSGYIAVQQDPLNVYVILPAQIAENVDPHRVGEGHDQISNPLMSSAIMLNNIKVAIMAFVGGITFGLFTIYAMLYNGLIVGALAAVFHQAGKSYIFWAYILPHGIIELTVIFIAGGAGLYMGYRMFVPGSYPRFKQLRISALESLQLLLGTIPLFVIAGIIEGYITPSQLSLEAKYAFAISTLLFLVMYYLYGLSQHYKSLRDHKMSRALASK